jgi:hypothetical protein
MTEFDKTFSVLEAGGSELIKLRRNCGGIVYQVGFKTYIKPTASTRFPLSKIVKEY